MLHSTRACTALFLFLTVASAGCADDEARPALIVQAGPNNPAPPTGFTGDTGVPVLQITLRAREAPVNVAAIRFHASGPGDDSAGIAGVRLYRDVNADGTVDAGDVLLGAAAGYPSDDGDIQFRGMAERIRIRPDVHWLLVYDFAPGASSGRTFCASILDAQDLEAWSAGERARVVLDGPIDGCATAASGTLDIARGSNSPPARAVTRCSTGETVLQIELEAGPREDVRVESVVFTAAGTADDLLGLSGVWLYADENGDGTLGVSDTLLGGPVAFTGDDGQVTFSGLGVPIAAGDRVAWILVYNLTGVAPVGATFAAGVASGADVSAEGIHSGQVIPVGGAPLSGEDMVIGPTVLVAAEYFDAPPTGVIDSRDWVELTFNGVVRLSGAALTEDILVLDPPGTFGDDSRLSVGLDGMVVWVSIRRPLGLQPNGSHGIDPGSTGISVVPGQFHLTDCSWTPIEPNPVVADLGGELNPRIQRVALTDANPGCNLDAGDTLDLTFTTNVTLTTADPGVAFELLVPGDSFGTGARFLGGGMPTDVRTVRVELGSGHVLTPEGVIQSTVPSPGDPSLIDVGPTPGAIVDAAYPAVAAARWLHDIPPLSVWTGVGAGDDFGRFGSSVASAGDVNADGYSDVIVGEPGYWGIPWKTGKAYVYHGGPAGPSDSINPDWTSTGNDVRDGGFGLRVASAGDVNGDGYSDVVIGTSPGSGWGDTFLYLGGPAGLSTTHAWTASGGGIFGSAPASAGDMDGDGYDDVLIGAGPYDSAFLFRGEPGGLAVNPAWTSSGDGQPGAEFGDSVASAGDVNGDGFADIIVGAPSHDTANTDAGKAYLYFGSPTGPSLVADWTSSGDDEEGARFGNSVASAGDMTGSGIADVVIGAPHGGGLGRRTGMVYLFAGTPGGPTATPVWTSTGEDWIDSGFGSSVGAAGDVNGDGLSDIIVGAPTISKTYVFLGDPTGPASIPDWTSWGEARFGARFGESVASAGDVRGNGLSEVIIGAPNQDGPVPGSNSAGKAFIYCVP